MVYASSSIEIAIPSYKRANILREKTISILEKYDVFYQQVKIFVANEQQNEEYKYALNGTKYDKCLTIAEPGMGAVRRWIQNYYPEKCPVLNMDDDLEKILVRKNEKTLEEIDNFWEFVQDGFKACCENDSNLWGIYAVANPFFMSDKIAVGLYYIIGSLWGCYNKRDSSYSVTLDDKEDFERSLKFYINDGNVCRLNYITAVSKYYGTPGGMQIERTEERIKTSALYLAEKYPELCKAYQRESTGHWELKLKDRRKIKPVENSLVGFFQ